MVIKYKFATGNKTEVEVSEEIGIVIMESRCKEHADNEKHRYHSAFSIDSLDYEDTTLSTNDEPVHSLEKAENDTALENALNSLTNVQRRRFLRYAFGMTIAQISQSEETAFNSVKESVLAAQEKLKKYLSGY